MNWGALPCLLLAALTLTSCFSKDAPAASPDVPTQASDIDEAQNTVFSRVDPTLIQKGQFVYILRTQELYSSQEPQENLMEEEAITVTDREDFAQYFDVTVVTERVDYIALDKPTYKFKNVYSIGYNEAPAPVEPAAQKQFLSERATAMVNALATSAEVGIAFYNLKIKEEKKQPPKKVLEHSDCVGAECLIDVTVISYDVVLTENGQMTQKNGFEVWLSADVPYFATVLKSCITTMVAVDTARPLVRQCQTVYDYRFTAATEPVPPPPSEGEPPVTSPEPVTP